MSHSSVPKMYISAGCSGADGWVILKKWRQEGQEFETSLNYALNAHFNHYTLLATLSQHPQGPFYSASELRSGELVIQGLQSTWSCGELNDTLETSGPQEACCSALQLFLCLSLGGRRWGA